MLANCLVGQLVESAGCVKVAKSTGAVCADCCLPLSMEGGAHARRHTSSSEENSEIHDYGIKQAPFVVLLGVDVPSVLVEVSCLSNVEEERKLNTEVHRENIARYLETGIQDYLGNSKGELRYDARR